MPRNITETADPDRLTIRTRVLDPDRFPGSLLQRAFIEFVATYTRSDQPGQLFSQTITYKIDNNGPNPESVPTLTDAGWTGAQRTSLIQSLNLVKTTAEGDLGF